MHFISTSEYCERLQTLFEQMMARRVPSLPRVPRAGCALATSEVMEPGLIWLKVTAGTALGRPLPAALRSPPGNVAPGRELPTREGVITVLPEGAGAKSLRLTL